jgi:hypothetical protein
MIRRVRKPTSEGVIDDRESQGITLASVLARAGKVGDGIEARLLVPLFVFRFVQLFLFKFPVSLSHISPDANLVLHHGEQSFLLSFLSPVFSQ